MARFVELNALSDMQKCVDRALVGLESGALLVHPTESVYGVGGGERESDLIVSRLKGRTTQSPILRLVLDATSVRRLFPTVQWSEQAESLTETFWPGPLTLVLDDGTAAGLAVRAESHPVTRAVLGSWTGSLGSTSLNRSGAEPARAVQEVRATLQGMADPGQPLLFLAAGRLVGSAPSTLLSLRRGELRLLREGAVHRSSLERAVGRRID